jgi:RHS repeat-associated protein
MTMLEDLEYTNDSLEAIYHSEGRVYFENGTSRYEYNITDHLGNTRLTFTDKDGDGVIEIFENADSNEVLSESHYYPFGMQMEGTWMSNPGRGTKYRYNNKELNEDFGLDWYDYGARWYDASIGRWNAVDALADEPEQIDKSVYAYAWNNPVNLTDPDGNCPICPAIAAIARGALVGSASATAIGYSQQVYNNFKEGKSGKEAFTDIDVGELKKDALIGAVFGGIGGKLLQRKKIFKIFVDGEKHPESARHLQDAIDSGKKNVGVIDRAGKNARRKENLKGVKTQKGKDRDEAPPAVIDTGEKSSVKHISPKDNRGAGGSIGNQIKDLKDGTKVKIIPKNVPKKKKN